MIFIKLYQKCKQLLHSIKSPVTQIKFIRYLSKSIRSNFHFRLQSLGATRIPVIFKPFKSSDGKTGKTELLDCNKLNKLTLLGNMGTANTTAKKKGEQHYLRGGEKPTGFGGGGFGPSSIASSKLEMWRDFLSDFSLATFPMQGT